jgi:putative tryptophan/tyrosine transport system substrate-binding protein
MRRRKFIALLGGAAAWPLAARAQPPKNVPRLCFLDFMLDPGTSRSKRFDGFFQGLNELGYVDGQTIAIDYLSADGSGERFPALVAECVRRKVDIIAVSTTPAAQTAKNATHTIPTVMIALGDPVGTGLVDTLARPGGNVTGTSTMLSDLAAKRLALLKEAVPGISRVLVLSYLVDPIAPLQVKALQEASRSLSVALQVQEIRTADDIPVAFEAGARDRADGLVITGESIFIAQRAQVSELALLESRIIYVIGHQATTISNLDRIRVYRRQSIVGANPLVTACHSRRGDRMSNHFRVWHRTERSSDRIEVTRSSTQYNWWAKLP